MSVQSNGLRYTYGWLRHIYLIGLLQQVLNDRITGHFVTMDIGSSYGTFPCIFKKEYTDSHHVLVDFSEQLLLAYYFLSICFPEARIAGARELSTTESISRDFVEQYDFVLVPCMLYPRLASRSIDLVANFSSFGEMSRQWFEFYTQSAVFQTAKYFFTANRIQSYPAYDSDLTILDYPIWNPEKRIHFALSRFRSHHYVRRYMFFYERWPDAPVFEYIGEI